MLPDDAASSRRGRPHGKPSVESRVIEACAKHWLTGKSKQAAVLKGVRIPEAGTAELVLLGPSEGTLVVVARTWSHVAAFAHVVGQAIGEVAHLMQSAPAGARALMESNDFGVDTQQARKIATRLCEDAAAGKLGIVFAIGFTDAEGEEPVRKRLLPVVALLDRWAALGAAGLGMGVHLWAVRLGEAESDARVEPTTLRPARGRKDG